MKVLTRGQYYGNEKLAVSINGVLLSQYSYIGEKTDWHYHENPYFMYVLEGNMMDCNTRQKTRCPPGSLMFNNWQEQHYGSKHSKIAGGFHLELDRHLLEEHEISTQLWEGSQLIHDPQLHVLFASIYREFVLMDNLSDVSIEVLALQICDCLNKVKKSNKNSNPAWVDDLKELLYYDMSDLSLRHLSEELNVHPVHISRAASKYLSMSLGEYIRLQKLRKAIPLILDVSTPLTEIAHSAGFFDQSHLNKVFKSQFKMNPSTFRKLLKKKPWG